MRDVQQNQALERDMREKEGWEGGSNGSPIGQQVNRRMGKSFAGTICRFAVGQDRACFYRCYDI